MTRLPTKLFLDYRPAGSLAAILTAALRFKSQRQLRRLSFVRSTCLVDYPLHSRSPSPLRHVCASADPPFPYSVFPPPFYAPLAHLPCEVHLHLALCNIHNHKRGRTRLQPQPQPLTSRVPFYRPASNTSTPSWSCCCLSASSCWKEATGGCQLCTLRRRARRLRLARWLPWPSGTRAP